MLILKVKTFEGFNNETQKIVREFFELKLEHSLVSLSKWEQKHEKPFLTNEPKTIEETLSYLECMCLDENVPSEVFLMVTDDDMTKINDYINKKMTATWFNERGPNTPGREAITAELIYYWMVALQIDWQAQYWHLNTLMTLVKVCNHKNQPEKKRSRADRATEAQQRAELNARRLKEYGTRG